VHDASTSKTLCRSRPAVAAGEAYLVALTNELTQIAPADRSYQAALKAGNQIAYLRYLLVVAEARRQVSEQEGASVTWHYPGHIPCCHSYSHNSSEECCASTQVAHQAIERIIAATLGHPHRCTFVGKCRSDLCP
jgi:hypothetical protein